MCPCPWGIDAQGGLFVLANRRKHPRIPLDCKLRVRVGRKELYPLRCFNISMGGMCVYTTEAFDRGNKGRLWLTQSCNNEVIEFEAQFKVLWVDAVPPDTEEMCMGIEFVKIRRKHQDNLLRLLRIQGSITGQ
ncbi:MAG: hypothetical protein GF418_10665 [Chitinivibrionales bacterium]|nr:hypothetical protein [Chitinivibrionales bacterium]MBD3396076.1 hypothetical protein [Chitinivibrionales bacterium]